MQIFEVRKILVFVKKILVPFFDGACCDIFAFV